MIKAVFFISGKNISGFSITGHADYSEGDDIVCASVSSAAYMAANTLTDVIGVKADIEEQEGRMSVRTDSTSPEVQTVLKGLRIHLKQLADQYPANIKCNNSEV